MSLMSDDILTVISNSNTLNTLLIYINRGIAMNDSLIAYVNGCPVWLVQLGWAQCVLI